MSGAGVAQHRNTPKMNRTPSSNRHGRVTKDDIRDAGLRRWDGRARITTDWINVFHDPELYFPTGDLLVYLRIPGQSSRGPAFRVQRSSIRDKGFGNLLRKCIQRPPLPGVACLAPACSGCEEHYPPSEIYMPAPASADLDTVFDHHITTRNFFAWLYDLPLAGRALGVSMIALKDRINFYRPSTEEQTSLEVVSFAESQRYLDFRECVDHALAALALAESLKLKDLWLDAFAHCVGMQHRSPETSIEYPAVSSITRNLVSISRMELEDRLEQVSDTFRDFFETNLSGNFLGLPQYARDHLDRFRAWLHCCYIEQYGLWPPVGFIRDGIQRSVYATIYSDFRNLYYHLVNVDSSSRVRDGKVIGTGGVCVLQNVQAYDSKYGYEGVEPLPLIPVEPTQEAVMKGIQRHHLWNPLTKRKVERENRRTLRLQALITASNRDWSIMNCLLVRRFSEFEAETTRDSPENISMTDSRKVRWILIYAVLQTLVSVMQVPKQVRNTEGLSYWLSCRAPVRLPWEKEEVVRDRSESRNRTRLEPDEDFIRPNISSTMPRSGRPDSNSWNDRHSTLPARASSTSNLLATAARTSSLRRFVSRRRSEISQKSPTSYYEIFVEGYGNGLKGEATNSSHIHTFSTGNIPKGRSTPRPLMTVSEDLHDEFTERSRGSGKLPAVVRKTPEPFQASPSVSRESSDASNTSSKWSNSPSHNESSLTGSDSDTVMTQNATPTQLRPEPMSKRNSLARFPNEYKILNLVEDKDRSRSAALKDMFDEEQFGRALNANMKGWNGSLYPA